MAASPSHLRSLYRSLLRELPPRPVLRRPLSPLHSRLREALATSTTSTTRVPGTTQTASPHTASTAGATTNQSTTAASEAKRAEQLIAYLAAQRKYVTLVERYNPGMNMDEEERIRLTARRVGMDLPMEYDIEKD